MNFEDNRNNRDNNDNCTENDSENDICSEIAKGNNDICSDSENDICIDDNGNCPNCGSDETESVDGYEYCTCGLELGPSDYDHGFVPTNPNPGADANDELGTVMTPTVNPTYRRLDRLHRRETYSRPGFVDGIIRELVDSGEGRAIVQAASEIIEKANAKESLGAKRHALRGIPSDMPKDDAKQYKQRLYAAAALYLLYQSRQNNRARILMQQWGLEKYDLLSTKKMIGALVRGEVRSLSNRENNAVLARARDIRHPLSTFRDHLASQEGQAVASSVYDLAVEIIRGMGEPVMDGDEMSHPDHPEPWTNHPAGEVAGKAITMAMLELRLSRQSIMELHQTYPVYNLDAFLDRISSQAREGDFEEEA